MSDAADATIADSTELRANCMGIPPLSARLEPWMCEFLASEYVAPAVAQHDSPLNVICTSPMARNIEEIRAETEARGLSSKIFFARKSNKCLSFIDEAMRCNAGLDTASENELHQCLQRGVSSEDIICTAAIKSESLIDSCLENQVCIAIDNRDELQAVVSRCQAIEKVARIAIRIGGFKWHQLSADGEAPSHNGSLHHARKLSTRFGFDAVSDSPIIDELQHLPVKVQGVHFHLDGYNAEQRVSAIVQSLEWIEGLRIAGHKPTFIDMGGGFPISYLEEEDQWEAFWRRQELALLGKRKPVTYRNHGLGLLVHDGRILGERNSYPYFQSPVRGEWFASILDSSVEGATIADRLRGANIQLRCEPGRSLVDGCGLTISRVEFCKQNADGDWLIGLSMNRTQCRTSSDDFLIDPIHLPSRTGSGEAMSGYLVGAYCTESELISLRKLSFPTGIRRGDFIVFPNTAGYLMHFLESRSHQLPLAKNLVVSDELQPITLDPIDTQLVG